jgi:hypothetical protein
MTKPTSKGRRASLRGTTFVRPHPKPNFQDQTSPGANTPSLCNGSTRPVLVGEDREQGTGNRSRRLFVCSLSAVPCSLVSSGGSGVLFGWAAYRGISTNRPLAGAPFPTYPVPVNASLLVRLWKFRTLVNRRDASPTPVRLVPRDVAPKRESIPRRSHRRYRHRW